jgi:lipid A 3-O-deacylase
MPKQLYLSLASAFAITASSALAQSQSPAPANETFSIDDNFRHGWHEATIGSAVFYSDLVRRFDRPNLDYVTGYGQIAYTVTSPGSDGFFRGSFQLAPEIFGAGITHGSGNYIAGATLWFRYNFVQPGWRLVPFIEAGGGGTTLDIPHKYDGNDFNFNLDGSVGVRWFVADHWSLNAEYRFQHISNANLWSRNIGVNTSGPAVGISFFF